MIGPPLEPVAAGASLSDAEVDMLLKRTTLTGLAVSLLGSAAFAQDATLPGNASSLREAHGDWTVACALVSSSDGKKSKQCLLSQQQVAQETRQRALAIELRPEGEGASGTLVLPFGLALAAGVAYQISEGAAGDVQPFRTCLPGGCIVDVAFDSRTVASLKTNKELKVKATADGGQAMELSISLTGFSSAYDRVVALMD